MGWRTGRIGARCTEDIRGRFVYRCMGIMFGLSIAFVIGE